MINKLHNNLFFLVKTHANCSLDFCKVKIIKFIITNKLIIVFVSISKVNITKLYADFVVHALQLSLSNTFN